MAHIKEITTVIGSSQVLLTGTLKPQLIIFLSPHCDVCSWNYVSCLPNCCVGTPPQDISYNQYACCLIFCINLMWEGNVRQAWHVPSIAYCELLEEILLLPCIRVHDPFTKQVDLSNSVCDLCSGGAWFESWLGQQLSCRSCSFPDLFG
jgi:hypothetical protein